MFGSKLIRLCKLRPFLDQVKGVSSESIFPETKTIEKTINQVTLLGRVGNEPQLKGTEANPLVTFSLATHSIYRHETGEYAQKTDWHRICVFKPSLRDLVYSRLKKGQRVHISGRLSYGSTKENSDYRPTTSIIVDDIIFFQHIDVEELTASGMKNEPLLQMEALKK